MTLLGINNASSYCFTVQNVNNWTMCIIVSKISRSSSSSFFLSLSLCLCQSGSKHQFGTGLLEWAVHSGSGSVRSCHEPVNHPLCHHQPPSKQHPGWYGPQTSSSPHSRTHTHEWELRNVMFKVFTEDDSNSFLPLLHSFVKQMLHCRWRLLDCDETLKMLFTSLLLLFLYYTNEAQMLLHLFIIIMSMCPTWQLRYHRFNEQKSFKTGHLQSLVLLKGQNIISTKKMCPNPWGGVAKKIKF